MCFLFIGHVNPRLVEKWQFWANLVEFLGERGRSLFVTQCYIWAFSG